MRIAKLKQLQIDPETHAYLTVSFIVLICCLIGIATRPISYLALLWPANAALLAIFLRFPHLNVKGGWLGAFCAYIFADLLTGNHFLLTLF